MHWTTCVTYFAVLPWLTAGGFVSRTPLVLMAAWSVAQVYSIKTGIKDPIDLYYVLDALSMAAISRWATGRDWAVLALYAAAWAAYVNDDRVERWWWLLAIFWAQALIAGPWPFIYRLRTPEGRRGLIQLQGR